MSALTNTDDLRTEAFDRYKKGDWKVRIEKSCSSTFDIAKEEIEKGAGSGTLVISDVQTGGKGRQQRKWYSPSGGIWMSTILKPNLELSKLSSITLLCAAAVVKTIENMHLNVSPSIKWPNDIYIRGKKVCGILTETILKNGRAEYVIVGIGINANNTTEHFDEEVKKISISFNEIGITVDRAQMASSINDMIVDLIKRYECECDLGFVLDCYTEHMQWINEEVVLKNTVNNEIAKRGVIKGIDKRGQLLMETIEGLEQIVSGELSLRRE